MDIFAASLPRRGRVMNVIVFAAAALAAAFAVSGAQAADVGITQSTLQPTMWQNSTTGFTLTITNMGRDTIGAVPNTGAALPANSFSGPALVTVTDTLPTGFSNIGASGPGWTCNPQGSSQIVCTHQGPLNGGQVLPVITVGGTANSPGVVQNCATVGFAPSAKTPVDTASGNNTACSNVTVQAVVTNSSCLMNGNAPRYVNGSGSGSTSSLADQNARNDWSNKAAMFGNIYSNWSHSAHQNVSCTNGPFGGTSCSYSAQPCP